RGEAKGKEIPNAKQPAGTCHSTRRPRATNQGHATTGRGPGQGNSQSPPLPCPEVPRARLALATGYHLILRDIQGKKTIAELRLGSNGYCSLAVMGNRVAAYESRDDRITVVEAETGTAVKRLNSGDFRKRKEFAGGQMPLAISPAGNLIACEA